MGTGEKDLIILYTEARRGVGEMVGTTTGKSGCQPEDERIGQSLHGNHAMCSFYSLE
jgi:hypothetical protein